MRGPREFGGDPWRERGRPVMKRRLKIVGRGGEADGGLGLLGGFVRWGVKRGSVGMGFCPEQNGAGGAWKGAGKARVQSLLGERTRRWNKKTGLGVGEKTRVSVSDCNPGDQGTTKKKVLGDARWGGVRRREGATDSSREGLEH